jgi:RNA polymerase sigma-70 factor (sigma-E family)
MATLTRTSFDEYVATRSGALLRFAYVLCGDPHHAEDLVQETLVKAHRRWPAIESENPDAYIKRALVRTHVSWLRRRASSEIATATFADDPDATRFDDAHASRDELWTLLATLPRAQRAVLVLRYFEDLDDHRIAELVGVTPSTVRVHAHRGLHALRETLARKAEEAPTSPGLLDNVRRGAARAAARRRALTAAGLATVIAALALAVPLALRPDTSAPPVEPSVSPTSSAPAPTPSDTAQLDLAPTTLSAPEFPYAFSFVPPGLGTAYVGQWNGSPILYYGGGGFNDWVPLRISARPEQNAGNAGLSAVRSTVTVNGAPATQWVSPAVEGGPGGPGPFVELEWQRDGLWFFASTDGAISVDDLRRFAEGMVPGRTVSDVPGDIDGIASVPVPVALELDEWDRDHVCAHDATQSRGVCIAFIAEEEQNLPPAPDLVVNGDPVYLHRSTTTPRYDLIARRPDGRLIGIGIIGDIPPVGNLAAPCPSGVLCVTDDDFVAIYRGITFTS